VFIDGFDDVTDLPSGLSHVNQSPMLQTVAFDKGEEIVIERQQKPIVGDCIP
jgi:hypothetical protein